MRILHVTDFHFNQRWFAWLAVHGPEYDAVCFTGDLVTRFRHPDRVVADSRPSSLTRLMAPIPTPNLREQIRWVRDWLSQWPTSTPLFICSGNHDYWPQKEHYTDTDAEAGWLRKARRPGNIWVDEEASTLIGGFRFVCTPWGRAPKAGVTDPVVALVHAPPSGTSISSGVGSEVGGDAEIAQSARFLPNGSLLLCGHVHQPCRWGVALRQASEQAVLALNPGMGPPDASEPNFIVLDIAGYRAEFHQLGIAADHFAFG